MSKSVQIVNMSTFWNPIKSIFITLFFIGGLALPSHAQRDMAEGMKSKALVDEMKEEVIELREKTKKDLNEKRERAIEELEKLQEAYQSANKKDVASLIAKEINQLKRKMGKPVKNNAIAREAREASNNQYFKYHTDYFFDEKGIIKGKLIFMPNQKVRVIYSYKGKEENKFWDWKDMGDHIQINGEAPLGTIIISEQPSSNLKSLLIRWGGELTHKLTDAYSE